MRKKYHKSQSRRNMKNQQQKELLEIAKRFQRIVSHYGGGTIRSNEPDKTFFSSKFAHELLCLYGKTNEVLQTIMTV